MGLIYDGVRIAQREAARQPAQQQKPKEWQPFTKLIWLVFLFGIPIAMGGAARVISFVVLGAVAFSVLAGCLWALGRQTPAAKGKNPVAEYLDQKEAKR
jgi:hypothetical protein